MICAEGALEEVAERRLSGMFLGGRDGVRAFAISGSSKMGGECWKTVVVNRADPGVGGGRGGCGLL